MGCLFMRLGCQLGDVQFLAAGSSNADAVVFGEQITWISMVLDSLTVDNSVNIVHRNNLLFFLNCIH